MVNLNKIYHFSRFQRGPTFSRGGGGGGGSNCLFPRETHITCDFPGGPDPLSPPSGSALVLETIPIASQMNTKTTTTTRKNKQKTIHIHYVDI